MSAHVSEETDQNTAEERLDLSRFEGHTPGPWAFYTMGADEPYHAVHAEGWETWGIQTPITNGADARLIAAAPDLLAALVGILSTRDKERERSKRLREQLAKADKYVYSICQHSDSMLMDYEDYMGRGVEPENED